MALSIRDFVSAGEGALRRETKKNRLPYNHHIEMFIWQSSYYLLPAAAFISSSDNHPPPNAL